MACVLLCCAVMIRQCMFICLTLSALSSSAFAQAISNDLDVLVHAKSAKLVDAAYGANGTLIVAVVQERAAGGSDLLFVYGSSDQGRTFKQLAKQSFMTAITAIDVVVAEDYNNHVLTDVAHVAFATDHIEKVCDAKNACVDTRLYSYAAVLSGPTNTVWNGGHLVYADFPNTAWPGPIALAAALGPKDYRANGGGTSTPEDYDLIIGVSTGAESLEQRLGDAGTSAAHWLETPKKLPFKKIPARLQALSSDQLNGALIIGTNADNTEAEIAITTTFRGINPPFQLVSWKDAMGNFLTLHKGSNMAFALERADLLFLDQTSMGWVIQSIAPTQLSGTIQLQQTPQEFAAWAEGTPALSAREGKVSVAFMIETDTSASGVTLGLRQMCWTRVAPVGAMRLSVEDRSLGQPRAFVLASTGWRQQDHGTVVFIDSMQAVKVDP
jgi:hypothetical protein